MNFLVPYLIRWNSLNRSRYYQLFRRLAENGHKVFVLQPPPMDSSDTGFVQVEEERQKNIVLYDVEINRRFWNMDLPFNKIIKKGYCCYRINHQIDTLVRELSIDVILFYNLALYPLSKIDSCFKIYDLGDDHMELLKHELGALGNQWVLKIVERYMTKMMGACDLVTSVSHDLTRKYPHGRSYILPNGINLEDIKPCGGDEIRKRFKGPIVGFVGSLEYFIDFDLIIETASRMKDITFIIAGGGRELGRLTEVKQRRNLDNLHLTGGLKHHDILRYISAMDICLNTFVKSPLTDAACPIKLFEYMVFKKPIISTSINEVWNIDRQFLYYADTPEDTIKMIRHIFSNPEEAAAKADLGFDVVTKSYTWDMIADNFLKMIENERGVSGVSGKELAGRTMRANAVK